MLPRKKFPGYEYDRRISSMTGEYLEDGQYYSDEEYWDAECTVEIRNSRGPVAC